MRKLPIAVVLSLTVSWPVFGQTPQPFPRREAPAPRSPAPAPVSAPAPAESAAQQASDPGAPAAETLVFPAYPAAHFLASYDAGRGQRYFIFGTTAGFEEIVGYYRSVLDTRGSLVFREPPTHMFEVGRFRDETMAFPPGVTVKDWTWGGSQGYPNPKLNAEPARFPTIIMIVPPPAGASQR